MGASSSESASCSNLTMWLMYFTGCITSLRGGKLMLTLGRFAGSGRRERPPPASAKTSQKVHRFLVHLVLVPLILKVSMNGDLR